MSTITIPDLTRPRRYTGAILGQTSALALARGRLLVAAGILAWILLRSRANVALITTPVTQTTLVASVTASGTVNPQNLISVGTQVSGTIASIDVDYNSKVKQGRFSLASIRARFKPSSSKPRPRSHKRAPK